MKVGICDMEKLQNREHNSVGSSRIRGRWIWRNWDECDQYHIGGKYDVLIFQKVYWGQMMEAFGGIKILDTCDPDSLEDRDVIKYMARCDAITTSTEPLANYYKKLLPRKIVKCIPDRIDMNDHKEFKKKHSKNLRRLVWFGYSHNFFYLSGTFNKLIKENLSLDIYSDTAPDFGGEFKDLKLKFHQYYYPNLHNELIRYDAALMPTGRSKLDIRGRYKSNNKQLTCYALGLPVIETPEDVDRLKGRELRAEEAKKQFKEIKEKWDIRYSVEELKQLIKELYNKKKRVSGKISKKTIDKIKQENLEWK